MTTPRTTAKKLCTDVEFNLVNDSFAPQVTSLSDRELLQRIKRARTARDKYRSLSQQQTREAKGRVAPRSTRPAAGNSNTVLKQKIFDETLARFEKNVSATDAVPAKPKAAVKKADAKQSGASKSAAAKKTTAKKSAVKKTTAAKKTAAAKETAAGKKAASAAKVPSLSKVVSKVTQRVAERKAEASGSKPDVPRKSAKAPAGSSEGSQRASREAADANPKGPEFRRNPHERGRLSSAFKQQQARRDSR